MTKPVVTVTRVQVAAANLRIKCDERLGRDTPPWIVRIAKAKRRKAGDDA